MIYPSEKYVDKNDSNVTYGHFREEFLKKIVFLSHWFLVCLNITDFSYTYPVDLVFLYFAKKTLFFGLSDFP